jgi:hypothetical protein
VKTGLRESLQINELDRAGIRTTPENAASAIFQTV